MDEFKRNWHSSWDYRKPDEKQLERRAARARMKQGLKDILDGRPNMPGDRAIDFWEGFQGYDDPTPG